VLKDCPSNGTRKNKEVITKVMRRGGNGKRNQATNEKIIQEGDPPGERENGQRDQVLLCREQKGILISASGCDRRGGKS